MCVFVCICVYMCIHINVYSYIYIIYMYIYMYMYIIYICINFFWVSLILLRAVWWFEQGSLMFWITCHVKFPPLVLDLISAFKLIMLSPSSRVASCQCEYCILCDTSATYHRLSDLMFCDYLRDKHLEVSWGNSSTSRPLGIGHLIFFAYLTSARSNAKSII